MILNKWPFIFNYFDVLQLTQLSENNFDFDLVECFDLSMKFNFMESAFYVVNTTINLIQTIKLTKGKLNLKYDL